MANLEHLTILDRGVESWNNWRKSNPDITPDLIGATLNNKNLMGYDFQNADIRSANFTNCNLSRSNFTRVKIGLSHNWIILLSIISSLLAILSGWLSSFLIYFFLLIFSANISHQIVGYVSLIFFLLLLLINFQQKSQLIYIKIFFSLFVFLGAIAIAFAIAYTVPIAFGFPIVIITIGLCIAIAILISIILTIALTTEVITISLVGLPLISRIFIFSIILLTILILTSIPSLLTLTIPLPFFADSHIMIPIVFSFLGFCYHLAQQALKGNFRYSLIRNIAITLATTKGTKFCHADLTDVNFSEVQLKNTDFRNAVISPLSRNQLRLFNRI